MARKLLVVLAVAAGGLGIPCAAPAQEKPIQAEQTKKPARAAEVIPLKEVSVTAARAQRRVDDLPSTVTIVTHQEIEQKGARNLKNALEEDIDLSVRTAPPRAAMSGRAGVEGINIRGLEGNQVLMMTDGIRLPNGFSFGPFATGRGDYVNMDGLKTIEVLRGPSSAQFGSDGLAGAVSFRTLDPQDILKDSRSFGGFARTGYASADRSWANSLAVAAREGRWQGLMLGSFRPGHELGNKGGNDSRNLDRTAPNPLDSSNRYLLGKSIFTIDEDNQLKLTLEAQRYAQNSNLYSARGKPPLTSTGTLNLTARDRTERNRVSLEHDFNDPNAAWVQRAETQLYWQGAQTRQFSFEDRNKSADRTRDNRYQTNVVGFSNLLESNFTGWANQRLIYGVDASRSDITGIRNGTIPPMGETFPVKPFPDTRYLLAGAFVQDEIERDAISVIPGLRFDYYRLEPSSDGYTGGTVAGLSDQAVTPRLGVIWRLDPALTPYAQWSQGFRAPAPDQVNNGFTNRVYGYASIGNPHLKPERADSVELGLRGKIQPVRYSLAAFDNRYNEFISARKVGGTGSYADPILYQSVNLPKARITGAELRAEWAIAPQWTTVGGLAYMVGNSTENGIRAPLDTINPLKAVVSLRHDQGAWGGSATLVHSQAKERRRIAPQTVTPFAPPSYSVFNLAGHWRVTESLTVTLALNNLFDTHYWRWSDVRGLPEDSPIRDAYTASGRNVWAAVRYDF